jgi:uncharacterized protein
MLEHWVLLALAGLVAGAVNAVAGGGSLISFPALLYTGMPSVTANATNTLALWPGTLSSAWAYRRLIADERRRALVLALPSLLGGLLGSIVLLCTAESTFRAIVPWLILFACLLLALQEPLSRALLRHAPPSRHHVSAPLFLAQLLIAVYGGYFGAGIGILMLASMGILMEASLQHANALKVLFSMLINGSAAIYFLLTRAASLREAALMAVCSLVGGYGGARLAQRLPTKLMRTVIVVYGVVIAWRLWR